MVNLQTRLCLKEHVFERSTEYFLHVFRVGMIVSCSLQKERFVVRETSITQFRVHSTPLVCCLGVLLYILLVSILVFFDTVSAYVLVPTICFCESECIVLIQGKGEQTIPV